jgi:uncharacterized Tic20 family protein
VTAFIVWVLLFAAIGGPLLYWALLSIAKRVRRG